MTDRPKLTLPAQDSDEEQSEPVAKNKLVDFLYCLLRDRVPPGEIETLIANIEAAQDNESEYENKHLEAYARELADRLK